MPQAYEVYAYTIDTLRRLLAEKAGTPEHVIATKRHLVYFEEYFQALGAKTVIVENNYVDRDYLEDFAAYYVRCFHRYERHCARLHFFDAAFTEADFVDLLRGTSAPLTPDILQQKYLGFVVVKPLPQTVVGRTCLKTYPEAGHRLFPITRSYNVHLFGIPLTVDSLAFQEQDAVAAACATSALWSAFQGTGRQFQHHIPSPVEITRAATSHVPLDTRTLPNNSGLNPTQMADAIRSVGLEPFLVNADDEYVLKSTLYAYLHGQIPILLGIDLHDPSAPNVSLGLHAVTVAGYSLGSTQQTAYQQQGTNLRSFRMDKIYAHDDQIGPFARMIFTGGASFRTSWLNGMGTAVLNAQATLMLVPLYHKIRIPIQTIQDMVFSFDSLVEALRQSNLLNLAQPLEWDVYLTDVNTLKAELLGSLALPGDYRARVLTYPMPRFLWRATALTSGTPILDLLFDATDIEQGCFFVCAIEYAPAVVQTLRTATQALVQSNTTLSPTDRRLFEWFATAIL
ncbi:MAG TPA: hypothetical protein VKU00_18350 [Chthonomonadaceae bacterium]|nr:hypothetical protein [Chthonomonadaceae bacterium]